MKREFPRSLRWLLVMAIVIAIQLIPPVALILTIFMVPFWSVFFVNAAIIGTGIEAIGGRVSIRWLSLPLVWFGCYAACAVFERVEIEQFTKAIIRHNSAVAIPFQPSQQALVFNDPSLAESIAGTFSVPATYFANSEVAGASYRSMRVVGSDTCAVIDRPIGGADQGVGSARPLIYSSGNETDRLDAERFCILDQYEDPDLSIARLDTKTSKSRFWLLSVQATTMSVMLPDGRTFAVKGGSADLLPWFPLPVIGCLGFDKSNCVVQFWRSHSPPNQVRAEADLAKALGLHRVRPRDRKAPDSETILRLIKSQKKRRFENEIGLLDTIIRDPITHRDVQTFEMLAGRADILYPKLEAMVVAVERARLTETGGENAGILVDLIRTLPPERVFPFEKRLSPD